MNDPIRILQVFIRMGRGGSESMIMNYYRNINREKALQGIIYRSIYKTEI